MKKITTFLLLIIGFSAIAFGQTGTKFLTNSGKITFFSDAPLEDITGTNKQVQVILDKTTGAMAFKVVMKNYIFDNGPMQKHFNEKMWLDTETFQNGTFDGKITNLADVNFAKDGKYNVTVAGKMTIKGVSKTITQKGTVEVKGTNIILKSEFMINVTEYGVKIPADNVTKLNKNVKITVDATLTPYVR